MKLLKVVFDRYILDMIAIVLYITSMTVQYEIGRPKLTIAILISGLMASSLSQIRFINRDISKDDLIKESNI